MRRGQLTALPTPSNAEWEPGDGGCLRLYRPELRDDKDTGESTPGTELVGEETRPAGAVCNETRTEDAALLADDALLDVAPIGDRLMVFFAGEDDDLPVH